MKIQHEEDRAAIFGTNGMKPSRLHNGEWDFHGENTQHHLHAIHPYPARFIPQIPHKAILNWTAPGDTVLDPFCGCGTTLLESILLGRAAIGIDNNPVAVLISEAKTAPYTYDDLVTLAKFADDFDDSIINVKKSVSLPNYKNFDYWFSKLAKSDLAKIKTLINKLPGRAGLLAFVVFSSLIVRSSHQDSDTRYARIDRKYKNGNAFKWFKVRLSDAVNRLREIIDSPRSGASVFCKDGRDLSFLPGGSIKLILTSPPYINAYDYHKYHRHRIHWIEGDVDFARDTEIGKHDTFTRPNATPDRYFNDMTDCFQHWHRLLIPGGHVCIVVGDGIVSGTAVPVGDKFIELCQKVGLTLKDRWIRNLQKSKKSFNQKARIDKEHLLLFTKGDM